MAFNCVLVFFYYKYATMAIILSLLICVNKSIGYIYMNQCFILPINSISSLLGLLLLLALAAFQA